MFKLSSSRLSGGQRSSSQEAFEECKSKLWAMERNFMPCSSHCYKGESSIFLCPSSNLFVSLCTFRAAKKLQAESKFGDFQNYIPHRRQPRHAKSSQSEAQEHRYCIWWMSLGLQNLYRHCYLNQHFTYYHHFMPIHYHMHDSKGSNNP